MRSEILKLRNDPTANAVMAGAFTKANAAILRSGSAARRPRANSTSRISRRRRRGAADLARRQQSERQRRATFSRTRRRPIRRSSMTARTGAAATASPQVRDVLTAPLRRGAIAAATPAAPTCRLQTVSAPLAPLPTGRSAAHRTVPLAAATATLAIPSCRIRPASPVRLPPPSRLPAEQDNQMFHGLFADATAGADHIGASPLVRASLQARSGACRIRRPRRRRAPRRRRPVAGQFLDLFKDTVERVVSHARPQLVVAANRAIRLALIIRQLSQRFMVNFLLSARR